MAPVVGLEIWYATLLPKELPRPSQDTLPPLLLKTAWAYDFRGEGEPTVKAIYPFLLGTFVPVASARQSLCASMARYSAARVPQPQFKRLLRELALATWISRHWTADQALTTFLSSVWMGQDRHGVREASIHLFGRPVEGLGVAETALLIATIRSPQRLDPRCHPERALEARGQVLERMRVTRVIGVKDVADASEAPLGVGGTCTERK